MVRKKVRKRTDGELPLELVLLDLSVAKAGVLRIFEM